MLGSAFIHSLPEASGAERDRLILEAVRSGTEQVSWSEISASLGSHRATFLVSTDALAIGTKTDWLRITTSHTTAQLIADALGCVLPTTKISDLIFAQALVRLTPCLQTPDADMAKTSRMVQHHEAIEAKRARRAGLVSTVGKDWVITNRLEGHPDRAANYGWHDSHAPNGRVWQPLGLAHDRFHVDYSQVVRLVRRTMTVDGVERDIVDVLRDPALAGLVSSEGPIRLWRLAAVPEQAKVVSFPPSPPAPAVAVPRVLRKGMAGLDVAAWQRVVKVKADGIFGRLTDQATRQWQAAHELIADGVVGPRTRARAEEIAASHPLSSSTSDPAEVPFVQARSFTATNGRQVDLIVLHTMEAPEGTTTAEDVAAWFAGPSAPNASAHYCIDVDSIVQCVREQDIAHHAPGANEHGIGLEHAGYARQSAEDWADDYSETMLRRSARLAGEICERYGLPVAFVDVAGLQAGRRGITTHAEVTRAFGRSTHIDPGLNFPMDHYLALIRELAGIG